MKKRISLKDLRNKFSEDYIPGKFVRGKQLLNGYLIVSEMDGAFDVYHYIKTGRDGILGKKASAVDFDTAIRVYQNLSMEML